MILLLMFRAVALLSMTKRSRIEHRPSSMIVYIYLLFLSKGIILVFFSLFYFVCFLTFYFTALTNILKQKMGYLQLQKKFEIVIICTTYNL